MSELAQLERMGHWEGHERRGIPIHVLNYIDKRLDTRIEEVKQLFLDHTREEMDRYTEILQKIEDSRTASEERHATLIQQLTVNIGHQKMIETAFLKTENGDPDFHGHHNDHHQRKKFADWINRLKDKAITRVVEYASVAAFVWFAYMVWAGILKGPTS